MRSPHFFSESSLTVVPLAILIVGLFMLLFNAHRMGKLRNLDLRLWSICAILLVLVVIELFSLLGR